MKAEWTWCWYFIKRCHLEAACWNRASVPHMPLKSKYPFQYEKVASKLLVNINKWTWNCTFIVLLIRLKHKSWYHKISSVNDVNTIENTVKPRIYSKTHHDWFQIIKCTDVSQPASKAFYWSKSRFFDGVLKTWMMIFFFFFSQCPKKQVCTWCILAVFQSIIWCWGLY